MSSAFDDGGDPQLLEADHRRRTAVLERDGHECQLCRRTGGTEGGPDLQVHTVETDSSRKGSALVTLCRYCHYRVHGSTGATPESRLRRRERSPLAGDH